MYEGGRITARKDRLRPTPQLDIFAELLSEEVPPRVAARMMGLNPKLGKVMLSRLRKRLGWQAV